MMGKALRDAWLFAVVGVFIGIIPGLVAGGAFATWRVGGDISEIDMTTIFRFSPWETGGWGEPFQTAALVALGVVAVSACGAFALGFRRPLTSHGSARWATDDELRRANLLARLADVRGPIFAKLGTPGSRAAYLTSAEIPHSLIAAPTGSGKGVGVVIPTLLTYPGSTLVLDLKGENFEKTSRARRAKGDRIFRFSPYADHGRTHRFNPLDDVARTAPRRRYSEARRLASSLVVARSKSAEGFLEGAREIFASAAIVAIENGTPTIGAVYDLLSQPGEAQDVFARLAEETVSQEARSVFQRMAATDTRVLSSYLSVLSDGGLSLWADPAVRDATAASDFSIHDLRRDPASIYLVVAPNDLVPLAPLVRLIFQQTIAVLQRSEPTADEPFPVLILLDEFASLGRMHILANAITTLRSYGGRVMIVVQSLGALREHYGQDGAGNLLANCRLQLFMAPADADTPDYISRAIGDTTRKVRSTSWTRGRLEGKNVQEREEGVRLIRPEELRQLDADHLVMLLQNSRPARLRKVRYYEDRGLKSLFGAQTGPLPEPPALYPEDAKPLYGARRDVEARLAGRVSPAAADKGRTPARAQDVGSRRTERGGDVAAATDTGPADSTTVKDHDVGRPVPMKTRPAELRDDMVGEGVSSADARPGARIVGPDTATKDALAIAETDRRDEDEALSPILEKQRRLLATIGRIKEQQAAKAP